MARVRPLFVLAWLPLAILAGGCGNDSTPTTPTTTRTSPVTETFQSNLTVQGSVWRMINAVQSGPLTATLTATDQPTVEVGLAIGLRNGTGTGCLVTKDVIAPAGSSPQLSTQVDGGDYCVKVFDAGRLQGPMAFTVTITYP